MMKMMKPVIVIKLGGSSLQNPDTVLQLATLVRGYQKRRYHVVLVHGGGPAINAELTRQNIKWQFINGQRQTTPEMMDVIDEVLAKTVNGTLVDNLKQAGVAVVGLSGATSQILQCVPANADLMCVGQVEVVHTEAIYEILNQLGLKVPVIAPIGYGLNGEKFNINADWAATQIAVALGAKKLVFLTDQDGILDQQKQLVRKTNGSMINGMITDGTISGGMFTKVKAMLAAFDAGVKYVHVLNAAFASQALSAAGAGTLLTECQTGRELTYERAI